MNTFISVPDQFWASDQWTLTNLTAQMVKEESSVVLHSVAVAWLKT